MEVTDQNGTKIILANITNDTTTSHVIIFYCMRLRFGLFILFRKLTNGTNLNFFLPHSAKCLHYEVSLMNNNNNYESFVHNFLISQECPKRLQ